MTILFFMNCYPDPKNGGIENVTRLLSEKFVSRGIIVHVRYLFKTAFEHTDDSLFRSCERILQTEIKDNISKAIKLYGIDLIVNRCVTFASPLLKAAISGTNCKLVTTYNNKPTLAPPKLFQMLANPDLSLWVKSVLLFIYPLFKIRSIHKLRICHQKSYEVSDITVLLSKRYIPEYVEMMKVDKKKLVVKNNPIKGKFEISESEIKAKEKLLLMVTRLDENQKCVIKALKIWQKVTKTNSDWKFIIVGNGPDEKKIKAFAVNNKIAGVEFVSACDPIDYYKRSSIFLMTSRNEGWPNTINEAMRMGCVPVVITSFSAVYDMIENEKEGFLVPNDDNVICTCSKFLNILINDFGIRMFMAHKAIEKTKRLSLDIISDEWIKMFNNLIENK